MAKNNEEINRRKVLKATGIVAASGIIAGCTGGGGRTAENGDGGESTATAEPEPYHARIFQGSIDWDALPAIVAVREFLPEATNGRFTAEYKQFAAGDTAFKAMLTGQIEIQPDGPLIAMNGQLAGADPRIFANVVSGTDYVVAARGHVESLEAFETQDLKFGISSPTSDSTVLPIWIMQEQAGVNPDNVDMVQIGGSSARTSALAAGNIDATTIHQDQFQDLQSEGADVKRLFDTAEYLDNYILNAAFTVPPSYLEERREFVQAYVNQIVRANRRLTNDFDFAHQMAEKYLLRQLSDEDAREVWDVLANTVGLWPYAAEDHNVDIYETLAGVYETADLIDPSEVDFDRLIVTDIWEEAVAEYGE